MYSRRGFLIGLTLCPLIGLLNRIMDKTMLNSIYARNYSDRRRQFIKQGWVLKAGDI